MLRIIIYGLLLFCQAAIVLGAKCPRKCSCNESGVICAQGGLTNHGLHRILNYIPETIENLTISGTKKHRNRFLISQDFCKFQNLKVLRLTRGSIKALGVNLFNRMEKLELLDVSDNFIQRYRVETFSGLDNLRTLILDRNLLRTLFSTSFVNVQGLQHLSIADNRIHAMAHSAFQGLDHLQKLNLAGNPISKYVNSDMFSYTPKLNEIDLSRCNLKSLDEKTFEYVEDLESVQLSGNKLSEIPFSTLLPVSAKLDFIDLSGNNIRYVPNQAFSGWPLQKLDLSNNQLGSGNGLSNGSFARSTIISLSLTKNSLDFDDLANLAPIMDQLIFLDVSENPLRGFDPTIFPKFSSLLELHIANVGISQLPDVLAKNWTSLVHLDLSSNPIKSIPPSFVNHLPNLEILDLTNCQLDDPPISTFEALNDICTVYLHENPWRCECGSKNFKLFLKIFLATRHKDCSSSRLDEVVCKTPGILAGRSILGLRSSDVPACSPIFKSSGLTKESEMGILIAGGCTSIFIIGLTIAVICSYVWPKAIKKKQKKRKRSKKEKRKKLEVDVDDMTFYCDKSARSIERAYFECNMMALYEDDKL